MAQDANGREKVPTAVGGSGGGNGSFAPRIIVNESFVRRFNLGDDVIGRRFRTGGGSSELEIVGLAAEAASSGNGVKAAGPPQYYQPFSQAGPFAPSRLERRLWRVRNALRVDPRALLKD